MHRRADGIGSSIINYETYALRFHVWANHRCTFEPSLISAIQIATIHARVKTRAPIWEVTTGEGRLVFQFNDKTVFSLQANLAEELNKIVFVAREAVQARTLG